MCLSSGYDFVRENSYLHVPGNFMGPKYDSAMLHYWKGYLKHHQEQLSLNPDIDVHAGLHAKSVEVHIRFLPRQRSCSALHSKFYALCSLLSIPDRCLCIASMCTCSSLSQAL